MIPYCFIGLVFIQSHLCPISQDSLFHIRHINVPKPSTNQTTVAQPVTEVFAPPIWNSTYHVKGTIYYRLTELSETFEGWHDSNRSRIDYQNGKTQTYQFSQMTSFGASYKVVHHGPIDGIEQKKETAQCLSVRGTEEFPILSQDILPDLSKFKFINMTDYGRKKAEYWVYRSEKDSIFTRHDMWLVKINNIYYPLVYKKYVGSVELKIILDIYTIVYTSYTTSDINPNYFDIKSYLCEINDVPHLDHAFSFNPMMELINSYKDNYYHYVEPIFQDFKSRYNKNYGNSVLEYLKRKLVFHKNLRFIHWHNRANNSYTLAVNQFADLYNQELHAMFVHEYFEKFEDRYPENNTFLFDIDEFDYLPHAIDWLEIGAVTSVKDQSLFANGWAHAISGSMEGAYFKKYEKLKKFSTQALIDCVMKRKINGSEVVQSQLAYEFIEQNGLPTEEEYILHSTKDSNCQISNIPNDRLTKITGFLKVNNRNEDTLRLALVKYGPIAISIRASLSSFVFYSSGVYYDKASNFGYMEHVNHGALLVGYGTVNNHSYWLVKNSWSSEWGEEGYIRIARKNNNCGVKTNPAFFIL